MTDDSKLRLFAGLELPAEWRSALARVRFQLEGLAPGALKWVRPDLIHLTLVFLGYQPADSLPTIQAALSAAAIGIAPFRMSLGEAGSFGSPGSLHVIWVGLAETPVELLRLHQAISGQLSARGIRFDARPLVPHITLARGRRPIDRAASLRVHAALRKMRVPSDLAAEVREFVLMESRLSRLGPDYQVTSRFPLGGGDG